MKKLFCLLVLAIFVCGCAVSESRIKTNEKIAQQLCMVYAKALNSYKKNNQQFPHTLQQLSDKGYLLVHSGHNWLILHSKPVQGYTYTYTYVDNNHFILEAKPVVKRATGNAEFKINETGELKVSY